MKLISLTEMDTLWNACRLLAIFNLEMEFLAQPSWIVNAIRLAVLQDTMPKYPALKVIKVVFSPSVVRSRILTRSLKFSGIVSNARPASPRVARKLQLFVGIGTLRIAVIDPQTFKTL